MLSEGSVSSRAQLWLFIRKTLTVILGTTPASALCQFLGCYTCTVLFVAVFSVLMLYCNNHRETASEAHFLSRRNCKV